MITFLESAECKVWIDSISPIVFVRFSNSYILPSDLKVICDAYAKALKYLRKNTKSVFAIIDLSELTSVDIRNLITSMLRETDSSNIALVSIVMPQNEFLRTRIQYIVENQLKGVVTLFSSFCEALNTINVMLQLTLNNELLLK